MATLVASFHKEGTGRKCGRHGHVWLTLGIRAMTARRLARGDMEVGLVVVWLKCGPVEWY